MFCLFTIYNLGKGGYISTYKPTGMKFSEYISMRTLCPETVFRRNPTYIFFLTCIKEKCQARSMTSMYYRKAYRTSDMGKKKLSSSNMADLERSEATYGVYKQLRGTPCYFRAQKKRAIGMVRQLGNIHFIIFFLMYKINISGKPDIFCTLSAAEKNWNELAEQIFQTLPESEKWNFYKAKKLEDLSPSMKAKMIADNFILMTHHFHKRIGKLIQYMQSQNFCFNGFRVADYFYR